jgi:hypothetical protein
VGKIAFYDGCSRACAVGDFAHAVRPRGRTADAARVRIDSHVGGGPGLVNEDQPVWIQARKVLFKKRIDHPDVTRAKRYADIVKKYAPTRVA